MIIFQFALIIDSCLLVDSEIVFKLLTQRPIKRNKEVNGQ